jgi:hypothetical protein
MNEEIGRISPRRRALQALTNLALGLAGLTLVLATFIVMQDEQDIRPVFMVTYCALFCGGVLFSAARWRLYLDRSGISTARRHPAGARAQGI